ncbi:hypothetical protein IC620_14630 [Hazenella sp. IB182357]|uniref:Uncharacterized protein n=1 Tax=Polycladospora coralii TaxID=2771432 RepID=A0A926NB12_9BACL|nr:hypothetical protein [Polycladospora coralii]MBD1373581.1 hypothetical protein [Polycladospora coralii]
MIQLQVKGLADQVYTFLADICNRPHIQFVKSKVNVRRVDEANVVFMIEYQPDLRTREVTLHLDGAEVTIPLVDVTHNQLDDHHIIVGKSSLDPIFNEDYSS